MKSAVWSLILLCAGSVGSAQTIATAAGNGSAGYSGDGGLAVDAELRFPEAVAVDSSGNFYIADPNNCRVRRVTISGGIITTIAGNGTCGFSGDGGLATSAELHLPKSVAVDASGNVYIADEGNGRIRKVSSAGIITTVAGNGTSGYNGDGISATSAELYDPNGVGVDSSGNFYIVDTFNERIRKVTVSTGIITTVAGNGNSGFSGDGGQATSAEINFPQGVAIDESGNIYIADEGNNRVRKISTSGVISTVAGNGTAGYSGDGGQATSAELDVINAVATDNSGNLYIADYSNNRIREVTVSTGIITTAAGNGSAGYTGDGGLATAAELNGPEGVAVNSAGKYYIADTWNTVIRSVTP